MSSPAIDLAGDPKAAQPPTDSVSCLKFSPTADLLSVGAWDNKVRIYEVAASGNAVGRALYDHEAPVLATAWVADGSKVVSGGCDNAVRAYDLQSGQAMQIGSHDAPVKCVNSVDVGSPMIATASWDKTLKYWDLRQQNPVSVVQLPERAYCMDSQKKLLVVGCANRRVVTIDLNSPQTIFRNSESPLKLMTRDVACTIDGSGYAISSVEGRCAIQYIEEAKQASLGFSFRCHRQAQTTPKPGDNIYAVDSVCFHPVYGTLVTAGSDGAIHFWDKESKLRLRYSRPLPGAVPTTGFNKSGSLFGYAVSYDWSKGYQYHTPDYPIEVRVHVVKDVEVMPRPRNTR